MDQIVMVHVDVKKNASCIEFPKKMSLSTDLNFWIKSVCPSSQGKDSILWRQQKKMSDGQMSLLAV